MNKESSVSTYITKDKEKEKSSASTYSTFNNDTDQRLESSRVVVYDYYYSVKKGLLLYPELSNNILYPLFIENLEKWIGILFKTDYLKIIYFLKKNKFCHARGFAKIFHMDLGNTNKKLDILLSYGIIELVEKEKYDSILYK